MRIQEIELTKQLKTTSRISDIVKLMNQYGWDVKGWGAEGAVARHPSKPYVLKLYKANSPYSDFVRFAQQHQSNPHLPKFNRSVRDLPGNWKYVSMEILQKFGNRAQLVKQFLPELAVLEISMGPGVLAGQLRDLVINTCLNLYNIDITSSFGVMRLEDPIPMLYPPSPAWLELLPAFETFTNQLSGKRAGNVRMDLHEDNFMLRNSAPGTRRRGTLVITDPYY